LDPWVNTIIQIGNAITLQKDGKGECLNMKTIFTEQVFRRPEAIRQMVSWLQNAFMGEEECGASRNLVSGVSLRDSHKQILAKWKSVVNKKER